MSPAGSRSLVTNKPDEDFPQHIAEHAPVTWLPLGREDLLYRELEIRDDAPEVNPVQGP